MLENYLPSPLHKNFSYSYSHQLFLLQDLSLDFVDEADDEDLEDFDEDELDDFDEE